MPALPRIIAATLPGHPHPRFVQAAHVAGHTGLLATEHCDAAELRTAVDTLIASDADFALSLSALDSAGSALVDSAVGRGLVQILLTDPRNPALRREVAALKERGLEALVQVTSSDEAVLAQSSGATALIVKGNEGAGFVGEETTFVLLQRVLSKATLPVYARGGIGLRTAAACFAAGVKGLVLDWQLALCEESGIPAELKARIERMDGSETAILGQDLDCRYRVWSRPDDPAYAELKAAEDQFASTGYQIESWKKTVESRAECRELLFISQDACFAAELARQSRSLGGVCNAILREAVRQCRVAARLDPLREGGPLAVSHSTRYPIVQGPMTRVSDRADFAVAVADAGALPVLALALMRGPEVAALLEETRRKLAGRPWGIGILGFVPRELREEQLNEARKFSPPFAIIAGGRPDQARAFERDGTATYLHVPSPELLRNFLEAGARRVVFEGRECGGHVGPRTSFVLWEQMIRVLIDHLAAAGPDARGEDYHVLFAGGIHDRRSAAMVAALAAPLAERGVRIGALMGTAYLFTTEAVATGAIQPGFQEEAIACSRTILLETGVGHSTRCAETAFGQHFTEEKRRLIRESRSKEEIRLALEALNLGRLRIAAKGITRGGGGASDSPGRPTYVNLDDAAQRLEGMYMIGQVAALRDRRCSMAELHHDVACGGEVLRQRIEPSTSHRAPGRPPAVAIVGLSCVFPKARSLDRYWSNILNKVNAIEEVPKRRWDVDLYFDPNRRAKDKVYSRWGGFIEDIPFDPVRYGMPPNTVPSIEPMQLLTLELVAKALEDAGYNERRYDRERTSVVVGAGGGVGELGLGYGFRSLIPHFIDGAGGTAGDADSLIEKLEGHLPEWTEDSFAGLLLNVVAGRVANRFDLGGTNYIVDAACATSLAAIRLAVNELQSGSSNVVIAAASDMMQTPFGYLCFSKTQALSPTGQCRTFDESADGIVISEGISVAVLKRLEDAERDGDRIYAVIRSVGASSDGRDKGLTAPRPIGQIRALERAYESAMVAPSTVGLIEAHGTGTVVGDRTEVESLTTFFRREAAATARCALGSVKSMIGHTKCTAGMAGLIKAALALHHKILPPTGGVTKPNAKADFPSTPFYLNTETRPWLTEAGGTPRRAGVSAFGFGGTNFHVVLEEYVGQVTDLPTTAPIQEWPAELFVWRAADAVQILEQIERLSTAIAQGAHPRLCDLANAVCSAGLRPASSPVLAIVATTLDDLVSKINIALPSFKSATALQDPRGIYYAPHVSDPGKIAFLFPGQGSQRVNMLADLATAFPFIRSALEEAGADLTNLIFPPPAFTDDVRAAAENALKQTRTAQPALGAAGIAMYRLLLHLGIRPAMAGGHSYGEFAALCAAGALGFADLLKVSEARGRLIEQAAQDEPGVMAAVDAGEAEVAAALRGIEGVGIANLNGPRQTVISGTRAGVTEALSRLTARGIAGKLIPVACAFHSHLVAPAQAPLHDCLAQIPIRAPRFPVYSNTTAAPHAGDPDTIRTTMAEHLARPVRWADEILAMYEAGARVFVEVGPGRVLTGLVGQILAGRPVHTIAMDQSGRNGLLQLVHALAQFAVAGVQWFSSPLFEGRIHRQLDLRRLLEQTRPAPLPPTAWMITAGRAVPAHRLNEIAAQQPAPKASLLQQAVPTPLPPVAPVSNSGVDAVLRSHRQLMTHFLDTHRNVMLGLLQGNGHPAAQPGPDPRPPTPGPRPEPVPQRVPVPEPVAVAPESQAPSDVPLARPQITERLLKLVSHRTGYPPEMLNLDLDMEADLGIDSIKRVEILGELQNASLLSAASLESEIENLSKLKTLAAIIDWIVAHHSGSVPVAPAGTAPLRSRLSNDVPPVTTATEPRPQGSGPSLARMLIQVVDAPTHTRASFEHLGLVLIVDDGHGIAPVLAARLSQAGLVPEIVTNPGALEGLTPDRPIMALVDLAPLAAPPSGALSSFEARFEAELKTLYRFTREFERDLRAHGESSLLVATRLGGDFASGESLASFWPGSGGVCGFVKAISREWPEVNCKVVDFDEEATAPEIADAILAELANRDHLLEVGYSRGRRTTLATLPSALDRREPAISIDNESVIVITGGARGITAEIATEIAQRFRPRLVLVGRSPMPVADESGGAAAIVDERELKATLVKKLTAEGLKPTPAQVDSECKRIFRERDMRSYLTAMRDAGSQVEYLQADAGDPAAFGAMIDRIYERFGRIDGVIHGAGIIEDKLLRDKTSESFDRVLRPKIVGALTLARKLRPDGLRFLAFFSSVSARYGNRGQCDYAAANETLNKLAVWLNGKWPGRIFSVNWGPWETARGMVSEELASRFAEAGVQMVSPPAGRDAFVNELLYGDAANVEVVLGGPVPSIARTSELLPLLCEPIEYMRTNGAVKIGLAVDIERHAYLLDHCLDGRPVMPMAMVLELAAEVASRISDGKQVSRVRDLRVLNGIGFENSNARSLRIEAGSTPPSLDGTQTIEISIYSAESSQLHYHAHVDLSRDLPSSQAAGRVRLQPTQPLGLTLEEAYESWLFHGPRWAGIVDVQGLADNGIVGTLRPGSPAGLLTPAPPGRWLIDPVIVDSALQLLILWARAKLDQTPLPASLGCYHRYAAPASGDVRCEVEIRRQPGNPTLDADLRFFENGRLLGWMENMRVTCSRALNRLAEKRAMVAHQ